MRTTSSPISTRPSHRHKTWPAVVWLAITALMAVLNFWAAGQDSGPESDNLLFDPTLAISGGVLYALMIAVAFGIAQAYPNRWRALGFRRFRLKWVAISLAVIVGTTIVAFAVEPILHGGEEQGLTADRWEPEHAGAFVANCIVLVLVGPFAEEVFFRGLGVRVLMLYGGVVAILVSGVMFGLVHGIVGALPPLILFGVGLGWVRLRSGSVWPTFIGHAAYNGLGVLLLVVAWLTDTSLS